jgi:hypothetical protein
MRSNMVLGAYMIALLDLGVPLQLYDSPNPSFMQPKGPQDRRRLLFKNGKQFQCTARTRKVHSSGKRTMVVIGHFLSIGLR